MTDAGGRNSVFHIATAGQLVALIAILLPVIGYLARAIAFAGIPHIDGANYASIAAGESIPDLASAGAILAIPTVLSFAYMSISGARNAVYVPATRREKIYFSIVIPILILFLSTISIYYSFVVILSTFFASFEITRLKNSGAFDAQHLWIVPATIALVAAVGGGLFATTVPTGEIHFAAVAGVASGYYSNLASDSGQTYLLPCNAKSGIISVNSNEITRIRYTPGRDSRFFEGLWAVIFENHQPLFGIQTSCPSLGQRHQ
jgi:hypothetical protein